MNELIKIEQRGGIETVNARELWEKLEAKRDFSTESGKELRQIPDERWGKVNSYPVEILEKVFLDWKHA